MEGWIVTSENPQQGIVQPDRLSAEEERRIREWVAEDKRRGVVNKLASRGTGLTVDALLATLDAERAASAEEIADLTERLRQCEEGHLA